MRVNHRRPYVLMPQQLLNSSNVIAFDQEMGGERMTKRVAGDTLGNSRLANGERHRLLNQPLVDVVSPLLSGLTVDPAVLLGKGKLPEPLAVCVRVFSRQGVRQSGPSPAICQVLFMDVLDVLKMLLNLLPNHLRQHSDSILVSLPFPYRDLIR